MGMSLPMFKENKKNWPFVQDSGDFKAAAVLGSYVCHTKFVQVNFPKIVM